MLQFVAYKLLSATFISKGYNDKRSQMDAIVRSAVSISR